MLFEFLGGFPSFYCRWYHGRLGRQVAEDRLRTAGETGSYLVRESERNKGSYVLSYLGKNGLTHFKYVFICSRGCTFFVLASLSMLTISFVLNEVLVAIFTL